MWNWRINYWRKNPWLFKCNSNLISLLMNVVLIYSHYALWSLRSSNQNPAGFNELQNSFTKYTLKGNLSWYPWIHMHSHLDRIKISISIIKFKKIHTKNVLRKNKYVHSSFLNTLIFSQKVFMPLFVYLCISSFTFMNLLEMEVLNHRTNLANVEGLTPVGILLGVPCLSVHFEII